MVPSFKPVSEFVPQTLDASRWESLAPLYKALIDRPLHSKADVETLLLDRSELDAAASEAGDELYIQMTCHTEDAQIKGAYLAHVEQVQPKLKEVSFELDSKLVQSPHLVELDAARYAVLVRDLRCALEIFRPENIALETELTKLDQEYSEISARMSVNFKGVERTLQQMGKFQEELDRTLREQAWKLSTERRFKDRDAIDDVFDKMLVLRQRAAENAGFKDYRAYAFKARRRFDYTPADCDNFAAGVEQFVVPTLRRLHADRSREMGVGKVRPWDLSVDVKGRPPLRPFENSGELLARTSRLFHRMDASLGSMFDALRDGADCFDLDSRTGKAPGGYQSMRHRRRLPFIFMNAVGVQRDVDTMVHEAGHAFHSLLCRGENLLAYRADIPLEFCEVASMSMELTSYPYLDEFYSAEDAVRARRVHMESLATILPWIATIDQFQHWIYTNPGHSRADRAKAWNNVIARFGGDVDWSGLENYRDALWHRQLHLFGAPFYYIEYGIAQLGALQLFGRYKRDAGVAIRDYKAALSLGGSKPLPELFEAAGLRFDFSPRSIAQSWGEVERELESTPA